MDNSYHKTKEFALDVLFPKFCLGCQKEGIYLCDDCRALLEIAEFDYCLCEIKPQRLPGSTDSRQKTGKCQKCRDKKLSGLFSALSYKEKTLTRKLIHQFKYEPYLKDLAKTLASILIEHFVITGNNTNGIWENGVLMPIPLDKSKIKIRGYNQAEELSKELSKVLQIPVLANNLLKIKSTKPQMELSKEDREKNLTEAFAIKNPAELAGKKIFLVDDVYTTGSTMEECAKTLRNEGAKNIWGIVIAREG